MIASDQRARPRGERGLTGGTGRRGRPIAVTLAVVLAVACVLAPATAARAADELAVRVSPERAHVAPGGAFTFSAAVYGPGGEAIDANVAWSVIPPRIGSIGGDGRFEAGGVAGRAIVRAIAAYGDATGTGHAVVEVGAEPPARLDVTIDPSSAAVDPGGVQQFDVRVTDPQSGDEVEGDVRWVVIPERFGTIDGDGLFTAATDEGSGRVAARVTAGDREGVGDAVVVVGSPPGPGVRVSVVPPQTLLAPGEGLEFEAIVTDQAGDPIDADVRWSVMPTRLGVVDATGMFTAGPDEGVGRIVASVATSEGPARGFAHVEVRRAGPAGVRIRVRPREAAVTLGGDVQFEALVVGPDGDPLDVPVDWTVRPAWIGEIDQDGLFTAADEISEPSANGTWIGAVVAAVETHAGVASDAARVIVRDAGPSLRLRIHPHRTVVAPGQEVQFETRVIGAGEPIEWTTEWAVFPGDLGTITPDGLFTANPVFGDASSSDFGPHEGIVGARATLPDGSTLTDRAHVRVRIPGQPVQIRVVPAFAIVPPGESMAFDAVVIGPNNEEVDLPVRWHVRPDHLGVISPEGVFTASDVHIEPGSWQRPKGTIVAEIRLPGGQVFRGIAIVVIDLADPEVAVRVSPKSVTIAQGDAFQFHAEVFENDGTPVELDLEWRVADPVLGTVDDSGLFTAASSIPQGHSRRTTVVAGGLYNGRLYWDFATVRVMEN
jgi:hypothetical protein